LGEFDYQARFTEGKKKQKYGSKKEGNTKLSALESIAKSTNFLPDFLVHDFVSTTITSGLIQEGFQVMDLEFLVRGLIFEPVFPRPGGAEIRSDEGGGLWSL
jgi:hypothetical protein